MSVDQETVSNITGASETEALPTKPKYKNLSFIETLVCFNSLPPAYCLPYNNLESVINGGFETGDFTGWQQTQADIDSSKKHSGEYSCRLYEAHIEQEFDSIPIECLNALGLWAIGSPYNDIYIYYDDETYTYLGIDWLLGKINDSAWSYLNLLSEVPSGKKIVKIKFYGGTGAPWWIDDITLHGISF